MNGLTVEAAHLNALALTGKDFRSLAVHEPSIQACVEIPLVKNKSRTNLRICYREPRGRSLNPKVNFADRRCSAEVCDRYAIAILTVLFRRTHRDEHYCSTPTDLLKAIWLV